MKRLSPLAVIVSLAIVAGAVVAVLWPPPVGGELYRHYEERSDIKASFFKDYKINDSVTVDVTMLEAKTSAGWDTLIHDFQIKTPEELSFPNIKSGYITTKYAPHNNYTAPMDTTLLNNDLLAISFKARSVAVFDIETEDQVDAILMLQVNNIKKGVKK